MDRHDRAGGRDGSVLGLRPWSRAALSKIDSPAPFVRARAVGLGGRQAGFTGAAGARRPAWRQRSGRPAGGSRRAAQADRTGLRLCPLGQPRGAIERDRALASLVVAGAGGQWHHAFSPVDVDRSRRSERSGGSKRASRAILDSHETVESHSGRKPAMSSAINPRTVSQAARARRLGGPVRPRRPGIRGRCDASCCFALPAG